MQTLTDAFIQAVALPTSGRIEIADARCIGLALRVTSAGAKSFSFKYRMRGRGVQRVTLGSYPALSLGKARAAADKLRQSVAAGDDPATERREQRTGGRTFDKLAARYLAEHSKRRNRPSSHKSNDRNLRLHVLPKWAKRDYLTIKRADVITLVEGIIATDKQTLANRVQGLVSKIFSFGMDAGLLTVNPCARMAQRGVETAGDRVLDDNELRSFWNNIIMPAEVRRAGLALRLTLLTGSRISEIAGIARSELENIDSDHSASWTIPGSRAKNKREHLIPLAPLALATLRDLIALAAPDDKFLLRGAKSGRPITGNNLTQFMAYFAVRLARGDYGDQGETGRGWAAGPPSPHDLRRTVETRLASLGVAKEYRDKVLNHVTAGVGAKHYDRHDYRAEKLAALMKWEGLLSAIVAGPAASGAEVISIADRRVS